jgi:hypothetical protein
MYEKEQKKYCGDASYFGSDACILFGKRIEQRRKQRRR